MLEIKIWDCLVDPDEVRVITKCSYDVRTTNPLEIWAQVEKHSNK